MINYSAFALAAQIIAYSVGAVLLAGVVAWLRRDEQRPGSLGILGALLFLIPVGDQAMQPTASRRTLKFSMIRASHPAAKRALVRRRSSCSR
jgi:hypothetical protein